MSEMLPEGTRVKVIGTGKWARMGTWQITKVNPTKYKLALVGSAAVILNAPHDMVYKAPAEDGAGSSYGPSRPEGLRPGAVVQVPAPIAEFDQFTLFVVLKDMVDSVNITPLGGDPAGRYWRVGPARLTVVDLAAGK